MTSAGMKETEMGGVEHRRKGRGTKRLAGGHESDRQGGREGRREEAVPGSGERLLSASCYGSPKYRATSW